MINAHIRNKMFRLINRVAALPDKNCALNVNISCIYFFTKNTGHWSEPSVTQNKSNTVTVSEFIWCGRNNRPSHEHFCTEPLKPLVLHMPL